MELRALISNPNGHSTSPANAVDTQLPWYTKDLMVEETSSPTSSPLLSLGPSPCDSTASSPLESPYNNPYARHAPAAAQPIFSLPRPRVSSALAQQKRKRSISDSLVPTASKKRPAEDDDEDEVDVEDFIAERYLPSDSAQMSHHDQPSPRNDNNDDESDGFVESGEEGDDGQADLEPGDASPRRRRLQGHESGPPSPPAFYQHGMNENPDGTAYYHCKFCQNTWPQSHFRNAQQFGAHCSNCSRKRKVKDPQDMTTTTRERNRRMRKNKRSRSISASKASFDKTRHRLLDSDDSTPEPPYSQELVFGGSHYRPAASSARVRPSGAPARPLPPSVLVGRQQPAVGQDAGMEGLLGAMQRRDSAQKRKSIFALLACVKSELASLREIEGGEEVELAGRELLQETRTEWESRIQELRVDAASDLRAHTAGLTRRLDRLRVAHQQGHPASDQQQPRSSLDFILNNASSTAVPATPPPSPAGAARGHHQHHQALRRAEVLTPAARAHVVPLAPQPPAVVASSSLACPSPLTSPL